MQIQRRHFDTEKDIQELLSKWSDIVNLKQFFIQITYNCDNKQYTLWYEDRAENIYETYIKKQLEYEDKKNN